MENKISILFFGTPDFAVPSLNILFENGFEIMGVVTSEDKPAGRGLQMKESAIKVYAKKNNLNILQPQKLRDPDFIFNLKKLKPDLNVVVAFRMLPAEVWELPPLGTINLHASLLPNYRGAAPINWAIINGEEETGVTTFFINEKIDTGNIIYKNKVKIENYETAGELHDKLSRFGADILLKTVVAIKEGKNPRERQEFKDEFKKAPKIYKKDCKINWSGDLKDIYNFIRGLSPYPCAWTELDGKNFKIYKSGYENSEHNYTYGQIITDKKSLLKVAVSKGFIILNEVQIEGKRKMSITDFLKGAKFSSDLRFN